MPGGGPQGAPRPSGSRRDPRGTPREPQAEPAGPGSRPDATRSGRPQRPIGVATSASPAEVQQGQRAADVAAPGGVGGAAQSPQAAARPSPSLPREEPDTPRRQDQPGAVTFSLLPRSPAEDPRPRGREIDVSPAAMPSRQPHQHEPRRWACPAIGPGRGPPEAQDRVEITSASPTPLSVPELPDPASIRAGSVRLRSQPSAFPGVVGTLVRTLAQHPPPDNRGRTGAAWRPTCLFLGGCAGLTGHATWASERAKEVADMTRRCPKTTDTLSAVSDQQLADAVERRPRAVVQINGRPRRPSSGVAYAHARPGRRARPRARG